MNSTQVIVELANRIARLASGCKKSIEEELDVSQAVADIVAIAASHRIQESIEDAPFGPPMQVVALCACLVAVLHGMDADIHGKGGQYMCVSDWLHSHSLTGAEDELADIMKKSARRPDDA